jgi:hypothetical protein
VRYNAMPWTPEGVRHTEVVQALLQSGLSAAGCLVDDLNAKGATRLTSGYDDTTRSVLLDQVGRPYPILLSADRTVAVEVSDLFGSPAVRMRSFLGDGSLIETQRRWDAVPPWPRRLAPFRRFTTVGREMTGSVAPGRTLAISDQAPVGQLDEHRRHVAAVSASRASAPVPYPDMESVASAWTAAFAHEKAVARRADTVAAVGVTVVGIAICMLLSALLSGPWSWVPTLAVVALVWWAAPGIIVLLRRGSRRRPTFAHGLRTT